MLKNLQNTTGNYFFLPHPVCLVTLLPCDLMQLTACVFRAVGGMSTDAVNYCYTEVSCYGAKIPALTGELLMTKEGCCQGVNGASWGGKENQCETCAPQASNDTSLPSEASGKYIAQSVTTCSNF